MGTVHFVFGGGLLAQTSQRLRAHLNGLRNHSSYEDSVKAFDELAVKIVRALSENYFRRRDNLRKFHELYEKFLAETEKRRLDSNYQ